ncbi:MAG: N-6 DNA methylase [bacterium]|nr:N-6 DNA methylase [bacterium]
MADERKLQTQLQAYHCEDAGIEFWRALGYDTLTEPLDASEFDALTESAREPLREASLLYADDALRIYHLHLRTAQRSKLRRLLESLTRRYPQYTYLFTARADDSPNLLFIQPRPVLKEPARYTLAIRTLEVQPDAPLRTDLEILAQLENDAQANRQAHADQVVEAFSVERVTERFYKDFRRLFESAEARITGIEDPDAKRLFTLKLFNRLLFVRFLERKGWLRFDKRRDYLRALWQDYQANRADADSFYSARLKPLFFSALNNPQERNLMAVNQGGLLRELIGDAPYLNGGLFEEHDDDACAHVPDDALQPVLEDLLYRYNFTITESTPLEMEVAVDPEMLGKVFEELVTGRHESGSYYTPRPVVAFMCREALKGYLQDATGEPAEALAQFVDASDASHLKDPERVLDALRRVRVCDPACGSGAYLLGMLHELLELRAALFDQKRLDNATLYQRKLEIIQSNLYGVDIDPCAVEIARLRLWLSLVVDDTRNPLDDPDADVALPNLDFKIEVGDSLLAPDPQGGAQPDMFRQQQISDYEQLKAKYLRAHSDEQKRMLRQEIEQRRQEIRQWAHPSGDIEGFDWRVEFAEVFKDGGFDIVVANPPYVRQELIPADMKKTLLHRYADAAEGRSDLYVYFYARVLQLLKPGGMHVFVCSNSWLDVGFGGRLQGYLLRHAHIQAIYDSALERQFASADVNTVITILRKAEYDPDAPTRFVRLTAPFEQAVADPKHQRVITRTAAELWATGLNEQNRYEGDKWGGKYLRAPDIYFTILEKGRRYQVFFYPNEPVLVEDITTRLQE